MAKVKLLGTGIPTPSNNRAASCYLIETGSNVIMFDYGHGGFRRLLEAGYAPEDISHLFFTHYHFDHFLDFPTLVLTRWDQVGGTKPDLMVFGPPPLLQKNELLFGDDGLFSDDISARTKLPGSLDRYVSRGGQIPRPRPSLVAYEIEDGSTIEIDADTKVTAISASHAEPYLSCLSYRLDTPEGALVYTGDTTPSERLDDLARDSAVLIHMCSFLAGSEESDVRKRSSSSHMDAARTALNASARTLVLTHMGESLIEPETAARIRGDVSSIFPGIVHIAEDLMELGF